MSSYKQNEKKSLGESSQSPNLTMDLYVECKKKNQWDKDEQPPKLDKRQEQWFPKENTHIVNKHMKTIQTHYQGNDNENTEILIYTCPVKKLP